MTLERLAVEADAARISAESADEACIAAREARRRLPGGPDLEAAAAAGRAASPGGRRAAGRRLPTRAGSPRTTGPAASSRSAGRWATREDAAIIRILRGDRERDAARRRRELAGDDEAERAALAGDARRARSRR